MIYLLLYSHLLPGPQVASSVHIFDKNRTYHKRDCKQRGLIKGMIKTSTWKNSRKSTEYLETKPELFVVLQKTDFCKKKKKKK